MDFLAVRSGMHDWLVNLWELHDAKAWGDKDLGGTFNVLALPGWHYARALALRAQETAGKEVR